MDKFGRGPRVEQLYEGTENGHRCGLDGMERIHRPSQKAL